MDNWKKIVLWLSTIMYTFVIIIETNHQKIIIASEIFLIAVSLVVIAEIIKEFKKEN